MNMLSRSKKSRSGWKLKAVLRGTLLRELRKRLRRLQKRFAERGFNLEREIKRLEAENTFLRAAAPDPAAHPVSIVSISERRTLCVKAVIAGIIPFRAVPRILGVFHSAGRMQMPIPHFTSVIHWSLRAGVAIFNEVAPLNTPWLAIIDCSINIGIRKVLVVLRVPLQALAAKQGAIGLQDCECIGLKIATRWNGSLVKDALDETFNKAGLPCAIIKDQGTDLNKGVELYRAAENTNKILVIDDVGHATANALKAEFAEKKPFINFLEIVRKGAARIRQTDLAWLLPPKIRTKGRFQGITEVAKWATKLLNLMGGAGRAKKDSELHCLRKAFCGLSQLRSFLERFCGMCKRAEEFLKLMKQKGINQTTYAQAKALLLRLPENSSTRIRLLSWLTRQLAIQCQLDIGSLALLVSSDALESLFGKFKTIVQRNPKAELNRLIYIIPLLCGTHSSANIDNALRGCSHEQMLNQIEETIPTTLRQQRHRILDAKPEQVPKTGIQEWLKAA